MRNRGCFTAEAGARDQKEVNRMGKYELAVVVNAQIDDEARTAVVDRCKEMRIMDNVLRYLCVKQEAA